VRHPTVAQFLSGTRSPVNWKENGFALEGEEYFGPRQAVYLTVHHPDVPEGGVRISSFTNGSSSEG
jgi:hypothetical protein